MKPSPAEKVAAFKEKVQRIREHGAAVVERRADGTVDRVRYMYPQPDGTTQWTDEAGNPIANPGEQADDAA